MNQKQEAHSLLHKLSKTAMFSSEWVRLINMLDELVCKAQNRKPLGEADGSISESMWDSLTTYLGAARAAADNHNIMLNVSKQLVQGVREEKSFLKRLIMDGIATGDIPF